MIWLVNRLCTFFSVLHGTLEFGCNGLSALSMACSTEDAIQPDDPCFDILTAIKRELNLSCTHWSHRHREGHQDDYQALEALDIWWQLNVEADAEAKGLIPVAKLCPRHYAIPSEAWSLWLGAKKIHNAHCTIYDIVHSPPVRAYWETKDKCDKEVLPTVDWDGIRVALRGIPKCQQHFLSKLAVGLCGVGKWMKQWGKWNSADCPRCGVYEDVPHMLSCQGATANDVWDTTLCSLRQWFTDHKTDPDIASAIIEGLNNWRYSTSGLSTNSSNLAVAVDMQTDIGWSLAIERWLTFEWAEQQVAYYRSINSRRSRRRWLIALIRKVWLIAWDLWEHWNGILHETVNQQTSSQTVTIDRKVRKLYADCQLVVIQVTLLQDFYMTCYVLADSHSVDSVCNLSTDYINLQVQVFKFKLFTMPIVARSMIKNRDSKIAIVANSSSSSLGNAMNLPVISLPLSPNNIDSSSSSLQESSSLSVSLEHHFEILNVDGLEFSNFCHPCNAFTACPSSQFFRMEKVMLQ